MGLKWEIGGHLSPLSGISDFSELSSLRIEDLIEKGNLRGKVKILLGRKCNLRHLGERLDVD